MQRHGFTATTIAACVAIAVPVHAGDSSSPSEPAFELATEEHDPGPDVAVWVEPIGSGVLGAARIFYLSGGAHVVLGEHIELVPEAAFTAGSWYGAGTTQVGAWFHLGLNFHTGSKPLEGFFLQPKLRTRFFHTPTGGDSRGFVPTSVSEGTDAEVGLGLDFGYQWSGTDLPLYVAFVLGLQGGVCIDCHDDGLNWFGKPFFGPGGRSTRGVFGVNLNFLRLGLTF